MFETTTTLKRDGVFLKSYSRFSASSTQYLSIMLVLLVAIITTSCGSLQANGSQGSESQDALTLHGNFPGATVNQPYNAVLSVSGGSSPYHFSVKAGRSASGPQPESGNGIVLGQAFDSGQILV